ncbi:unnamed protein product [Allacma fusca]|uniref:DUF4200 domain-containing protein n=1 Tax=Allacma fusca TaxID=39272 RepID=A0A8J2PNC2_9HEXA|nr:unnamed protein product [Allacma fusca]
MEKVEEDGALTSSASMSAFSYVDSGDSQTRFSPVEMPTRPWMPIELPTIGELRKSVRQRPKFTMPQDTIVVPFVDGDDQRNPFDIPVDIPGYMYKHLEERAKERLDALAVPTLEKETMITKAYKLVSQRVAPFSVTSTDPSERQIWQQVIWEAKRGLNVSKMQKISRNVSSAYITHRKRLFYLDHAIHARRLALKKLRRDAELEERALKNFEWLVQFTQDAFDTFLKENDDDTMAAVHAAETALKEKLEKMLEARTLSIHINTVKTDILAANESLKECKSYMKFLDDIATELMRRDELEATRAARRQQQIKEEMLKFLKEGMTLTEARAAVKANENEAIIDTFGGKFSKNSGEQIADDTSDAHFLSQLQEEAQGGMVSIEENESPSETLLGEDPDGFNESELLNSMELVGGNEVTDRQELANLSFTNPKQLLDIYLEMEEQNLSLIQHAQHSEETLEGIQGQIRKTKKIMDHKARLLRNEINKTEAANDKMEERVHAIKAIINMFSGGHYDVKGQEKFMRLLRKHVSKVFKTAITNNKIANDSQLTAVLMLTAVEKQFEDLVRDIESMPTEVVVKISREMEKDRRENERLERMQDRKYKQSQRVNRSIERAKAPVKHKRGRPLFPRSRPPKEVINLSQNDLDIKAAEDEYNYYFGE